MVDVACTRAALGAATASQLYMEVQFHGQVLLGRDVSALVVGAAHKPGSRVARAAAALGARFTNIVVVLLSEG